MLPYGGSLPKGTILLGTGQSKGQKRLYISFTMAVLPDGGQIPIRAQALDPSDYAPGVIGKYHSMASTRIAATMGMSMVSGIAEALSGKRVLGGGVIVSESNLKSALYHGASKATQLEASRQAQKLLNERPYLTLEVGHALVVSFSQL